MKKVLCLALALATVPFRTAHAEDPDCSNPDTAKLYQGTFHWKLLKSAKIPQSDGSSSRVRMWHSVEVADCSGNGAPMYAVRLFLESDGKVLFRYDPGRNSLDYWLWENFTLRDVKKLGAPQVVFITGYESATDRKVLHHVVPVSGPQRYTDIGAKK